MDGLFSIILKAIATVFIVYALMIPLYKHHNLVNLFDGGIVFLSVIVLLIFEATTAYLLFGIMMGTLLILYLVLKYGVLKRFNQWYFIFHVTRKDLIALDELKQKMIDEAVIEPNEILLSKYPFLLQIIPSDHIKRKLMMKYLDRAIKTKFNYLMSIRYGIFLLIFIILAIIWRF